MNVNRNTLFHEPLAALQNKLLRLLKDHDGLKEELVNASEKLRECQSNKDCAELYKTYLKVVLDATYKRENELVNDEFCDSNSVNDINEIISILTDAERLCQHFESQSIMILNEEMVKCFRWRKGALLYMYCATIHSDPNRKTVMKESHLKKLLSDGMMYLVNAVTTSKSSLHNFASNSSDSLALINKVACNSTELLAMMYAGEMGYWYETLPSQKTSSSEGYPTRELTMALLSNYVQIVERPEFHGWSSKKAKELLNTL